MSYVDFIKLESDEDGWELVVETDEDTHVFNVHGIASSGELDDQLRKVLQDLGLWREEGRAAAREYDIELAKRESDEAYDRLVGDA